MLSEEEKQAIEFFEKSFKKKIPPYWYDDTISNIEEKIKTILNLIKKQSKEIEELKEKDDANLAYYDQIYQNGIYTGQKAVEDKIKAKIEEIENKDKKYKNYLKDGRENFTPEYVWARPVLQSLLEKE